MPKASDTGELHRHASQRSYAFHNNLHANAQSKSGPVVCQSGDFIVNSSPISIRTVKRRRTSKQNPHPEETPNVSEHDTVAIGGKKRPNSVSGGGKEESHVSPDGKSKTQKRRRKNREFEDAMRKCPSCGEVCVVPLIVALRSTE